jgi:SRC kinase signaling inhibitor 1
LVLSDDNSQTIQNTVTTKMSQSQLYIDSTNNNSTASLKRLHSYPSGSDTEPDNQISPPREKPPLPERNAELLSRYNKKLPPPPPPRTSSNSRSPSSPTSPNIPPKGVQNKDPNDSGSESANSQDNSQRQQQLEVRHQELLKKQKQLQEQYQKLQKMSSIPIQAGGEKSTDGKESSQATITNKVYETDIL